MISIVSTFCTKAKEHKNHNFVINDFILKILSAYTAVWLKQHETVMFSNNYNSTSHLQ